MLGRAKCKILKEIRQKIADENDISYVTRECTYQGDCSGTCPKCESELRYLERELEKRQRMGRSVAVTALCAGLALGTAGCSPKTVIGGDDLGGAAEIDDITVLEGEEEYIEEPEPEDDMVELSGDVEAPLETAE